MSFGRMDNAAGSSELDRRDCMDEEDETCSSTARPPTPAPLAGLAPFGDLFVVDDDDTLRRCEADEADEDEDMCEESDDDELLFTVGEVTSGWLVVGVGCVVVVDVVVVNVVESPNPPPPPVSRAEMVNIGANIFKVLLFNLDKDRFFQYKDFLLTNDKL